jgi:aminopeptidase N
MYLVWLFLDVLPLLFSSIFQSSKFLSKRTSCSVATEPPPAATEEPEMDLPKEIFLKDYKKPDYLFDTVTRLSFSILESVYALPFLENFLPPRHMAGCDQ